MLLLFGLGTLLLLWAALSGFARADITSIKALLRWVVALGGILLAVMLVLTGRGGLALFALTMLGPAAWNIWRSQAARPLGTAAPSRGTMSRAEAYAVLGLPAGASPADIKAAHLRLMRGAHPDSGGSDWLASRINQARDVLLG